MMHFTAQAHRAVAVAKCRKVPPLDAQRLFARAAADPAAAPTADVQNNQNSHPGPVRTAVPATADANASRRGRRTRHCAMPRHGDRTRTIAERRPPAI